jgi:hypothetical protein
MVPVLRPAVNQHFRATWLRRSYPANGSNLATQTSFHVVRVGLNYRFGGSDVVRARY